jgi:hypothetical protein
MPSISCAPRWSKGCKKTLSAFKQFKPFKSFKPSELTGPINDLNILNDLNVWNVPCKEEEFVNEPDGLGEIVCGDGRPDHFEI